MRSLRSHIPTHHYLYYNTDMPKGLKFLNPNNGTRGKAQDHWYRLSFGIPAPDIGDWIDCWDTWGLKQGDIVRIHTQTHMETEIRFAIADKPTKMARGAGQRVVLRIVA